MLGLFAMTKYWYRKRSKKQLHNDQSGFMSSMVQFFDFHEDIRSKTMLSINDGFRKHADGNKMSKAELEMSTDDDMHELMDAGVYSFEVEDKMTKISTASGQSSRGHLESPTAKEKSKEQDQEPQSPNFSSQSMSLSSFYESELEDHSLRGKSTRDGVTGVSISSMRDPHPHTLLDELRRQLLEKHAILQDKLDEAKESFLRQKSMDVKDITEDVTLQSKEFLDALEKFNANRELFLKILQDPNSVLADHIGSDEGKVKSKPGFFSRAVASGRSRAKANWYKEKAIGSLEKHEGKLQDPHPNSMPIMDDDNVNGGLQLPAKILILKPVHGSPRTARIDSLVLSPAGSPHELKSKSESGSVANHFNGIKQRIKHVIEESRKERRRISIDGILHKIPYGHKTSKVAKIHTEGQWKETMLGQVGRDSPRFSYGSPGSSSSRSWDSLNSFGRMSIGESPVRHFRWPESALSRVAKRNNAERLKLVHDDECLHGRRDLKPLGRIVSLPEFKTQELCSSDRDDQSEVGSEMIDSENTGSLGNSDEQCSVGTSIGTEYSNFSTENLEEPDSSGLIEGVPVLQALDAEDVTGSVLDSLIREVNNYNPLDYHETSTQTISFMEMVKPSPDSEAVLGSYFQEDIAKPGKYSISEGNESKLRNFPFDDMVIPSASPKEQIEMDTPKGTVIRKADIQMVPIPTHHAVSESKHIQVDARDEAKFSYVRDVLKASGFSNDEFLGMWHIWHSPDQPVNPSLFDEVEGSLNHNIFQNDVRSCDHQLLFDCINEVLLEIYKRSYSDRPWILSFNSHIWPMPVGHHVLEEVWASISWHLSSQSQPNPSLEYIVSRDLAKNDNWMDLRSDIELVGLELEVLILDALLEEALLPIGTRFN